MISKKISSGQTLLEVVMVLAIGTIMLVSIVSLGTVSVKNTVLSRNKTQATKFSQEAVEWLRGERDSDWNTFVGRAAIPTWCMPTLSWTKSGACSDNDTISATIFRREARFTTIDANTIEAISVVSWDDSGGYREVKSSTYFTNWRGSSLSNLPTSAPTPGPTIVPLPITFSYTGGQQSWLVPAGVTSITVDALGAQGGVGDAAAGVAGGAGRGARNLTTISVTAGETLYIYVGGAGAKPEGGFNGGGTGGGTAVTSYKAGGGGGASDVRRGGSELANRVVVAAGGAGGACGGDLRVDVGGSGGSGGGISGAAGGNGTGCCDTAGGGGGASQTSGGAGGAASGDGRSRSGGTGGVGVGGNGASSGEDVGCGAAGGGGYYGGGGGASSGGAGGGGGGGGSSWTSGSNTTYTVGYKSGNGSVTITVIQ